MQDHPLNKHTNCSCGHVHEHSEKHAKNQNIKDTQVFGNSWVNSQNHDGAIVISAGCSIHGDQETISSVIVSQLKDLAVFVQERGGVVGHIKASIETNLVKMFSITDQDVMTKQATEQEIEIHFAVIVFSVKIEEVKQAVIRMLDVLKAPDYL